MNRLIFLLLIFIFASCVDNSAPTVFNVEELDKNIETEIGADLAILRKDLHDMFPIGYSSDSLLNRIGRFGDDSYLEILWGDYCKKTKLSLVNVSSVNILEKIFTSLDKKPCKESQFDICLARSDIRKSFPQDLYVGDMLSGMMFLNLIGELRTSGLINDDELDSLLILRHVILSIEYE